MFDPINFIPDRDRVRAATTHPTPYVRAWVVAHSGKCLSDAIDEVSSVLGVPYGLASSLVWAEMASPTVRIPT